MIRLIQIAVCWILSLASLWSDPSSSDETLAEASVPGSDSQKTVQVTATGVGLTPDSAEKAALANAVQQAVGMYLDSETLVKNEQLLDDKILSVSDGFISHVAIKVPVRKRLSDGLFETTIIAVVEKNKVGFALSQANLLQSTTDGRDAWAEVVTKIENAQDATEALKEHFAKIQVKLLTARLIPSTNESGAEVDGPQVKPDPSTNTAICAWNIEVSYDRKAYYEQAFPFLEKCLGALADRRGQDFVLQSRISVPNQYDSGSSTRNSAVLGTLWRLYLERDNQVAEKLDQGEFLVGLNVSSDRSRQNMRFQTYVLNDRLYYKWLTELQAPLSLQILLLNSEDKVIHDETVSLDRTLYALTEDDQGIHHNEELPPWAIHMDALPLRIIRPRLGYLIMSDYINPSSVWFTPDFRGAEPVACPRSGIYWSLMDNIIIHYEVSLDPDDIKNIKTVRFEFVPDTTQQ